MLIQIIIVALFSAFSLLGLDGKAQNLKHLGEVFKEIGLLQASQMKCYDHCALLFAEPEMAGVLGPCIMTCDKEINKDMDRQKQRLKNIQKN